MPLINTLQYVNDKFEKINKKIENANLKSKEMLNSAINKQNEIKNILAINNTSLEDIIADEDVIDPIYGVKLKKAKVQKTEIEMRSVISSDEITDLAKCSVRGQVVKENAFEIIDKSDTSSFYIEQSYENILSNYTFNDSDNFVCKNEGLFFEVCIELPNLSKINYISISGISFFYQNIAYIKYTKNDNEYEKITLKENYDILFDNIFINLDSFFCKKLYIGFVQTHYILKSNGLKTLYMYSCSINKISAGYNVYESRSGFKTLALPISGNGNSLILKCDVNSDREKNLCEEFSISFDGDNFFNILPFNVPNNEVFELLNFKGTFATLRFFAKTVHHVYENGLPLDKSKYVAKEANGYIYAIYLDKEPSSVYTVFYETTDESKFIKRTSNTKYSSENEIIKCDGSNVYSLTKNGVTDVKIEILDSLKGRLYKDNQVKEDSGSLTASKFAYHLSSNSIIFNNELDDRYTVNVSYKVFTKNVTLRCIFRHTGSEINTTKNSVKNINILYI